MKKKFSAVCNKFYTKNSRLNFQMSYIFHLYLKSKEKKA